MDGIDARLLEAYRNDPIVNMILTNGRVTDATAEECLIECVAAMYQRHKFDAEEIIRLHEINPTVIHLPIGEK